MAATCRFFSSKSYKESEKACNELIPRPRPDFSEEEVLVSGGTLLHLAAKHCDPRLSELFMAKGATCVTKDDKGRTPIHFAASRGLARTCTRMMASAIKDLKRRNIPVGAFLQDHHGRTPLHYAAAFGYPKTCKTIVDVYRAGMRGSDAEEDRDDFLDLEDERGYTASAVAAIRGFPEVFSALNSHGGEDALMRLTFGPNGQSCFHVAAEKGHLGIVKLAPGSHEMLGHRAAEGGTMLQFAAQQGRLAVVEHLLHEARRLGFPLEDLVDDHGSTPLHAACMSGHAKVCKALIEAGIPVNTVQRKHGVLALHMGVHWERVVACGVLIANGADLSHRNFNGEFPMDEAEPGSILRLALEEAGMDNDKCVELLLEYSNPEDAAKLRDLVRDDRRRKALLRFRCAVDVPDAPAKIATAVLDGDKETVQRYNGIFSGDGDFLKACCTLPKEAAASFEAVQQDSGPSAGEGFGFQAGPLAIAVLRNDCTITRSLIERVEAFCDVDAQLTNPMSRRSRLRRKLLLDFITRQSVAPVGCPSKPGDAFTTTLVELCWMMKGKGSRSDAAAEVLDWMRSCVVPFSVDDFQTAIEYGCAGGDTASSKAAALMFKDANISANRWQVLLAEPLTASQSPKAAAKTKFKPKSGRRGRRGKRRGTASVARAASASSGAGSGTKSYIKPSSRELPIDIRATFTPPTVRCSHFADRAFQKGNSLRARLESVRKQAKSSLMGQLADCLVHRTAGMHPYKLAAGKEITQDQPDEAEDPVQCDDTEADFSPTTDVSPFELDMHGPDEFLVFPSDEEDVWQCSFNTEGTKSRPNELHRALTPERQKDRGIGTQPMFREMSGWRRFDGTPVELGSRKPKQVDGLQALAAAMAEVKGVAPGSMSTVDALFSLMDGF